MKRLRFEFETRLEFSRPVSGHCFTLRCTPFSDGRQTVTEALCEVTPSSGKVWHSRDSFGNMLICGRMDEPHELFSFRVSGEARIVNSAAAAGSAAPFYRFRTPLTSAGEKILSFYEEHRPERGDALARTLSLTESLYGSMTYRKGVTATDTTAEQAMAAGAGVCQDYSHILLSLLRLEGIPCRYASGLAFQSGETHAWVEIFDGTQWIGVDPTHDRIIGDSYIKLCHGRDYSVCPIERGIYLGSARSVQTI
ncbi:MAG: transglutaminase domain-containing protein, partial [Oscillospiraceae bacterium]